MICKCRMAIAEVDHVQRKSHLNMCPGGPDSLEFLFDGHLIDSLPVRLVDFNSQIFFPLDSAFHVVISSKSYLMAI